MPEPEREPVFIAANVREADFVEELLDEAGIEYEEKLEAFMRDDVSSAVCYQGTLFEGSRGTGGILPKVIDGERGSDEASWDRPCKRSADHAA